MCQSVTCKLGETAFYNALTRPCWSERPLDLLLHKATERDCFCVLKPKWTRSRCFSDGEVRCGGDITNVGAAGSN